MKTRLLLCIAALALAAPVVLAAPKKALVINTAADPKFAPTDPSNPAGPQAAVLSGDPTKGASVILLKVPSGMAPMHSHTASYKAVVIEGPVKHWDAKDTEAASPTLPIGSTWQQPGGQIHGDECLAPKGSNCLLYIEFAGKLDFVVAGAPKK